MVQDSCVAMPGPKQNLTPPLNIAIAIDLGQHMKPAMYEFQVSTPPLQLKMLGILREMLVQSVYCGDKSGQCNKGAASFNQAIDKARFMASNSIFNTITKPSLGSVSPKKNSLELQEKSSPEEQARKHVKKHRRLFARQGTPVVEQCAGFSKTTLTEGCLPRICEGMEDESSKDPGESGESTRGTLQVQNGSDLEDADACSSISLSDTESDASDRASVKEEEEEEDEPSSEKKFERHQALTGEVSCGSLCEKRQSASSTDTFVLAVEDDAGDEDHSPQRTSALSSADLDELAGLKELALSLDSEPDAMPRSERLDQRTDQPVRRPSSEPARPSFVRASLVSRTSRPKSFTAEL